MPAQLWLNGWRCRTLFNPHWPHSGEVHFPVTVTPAQLAALPEWDSIAVDAINSLLPNKRVVLHLARTPSETGIPFGGYWITAVPEPVEVKDGLRSLYQKTILAHYRNPYNKGVEVDNPAFTARMQNPTCGDDVELKVAINSEGVVTRIGWTGRGCSVSMASASLLAVMLEGRHFSELEATIDSFTGMVSGVEGDYSALGDLQAFQDVRRSQARIKCATLAWRCLDDGLKASPVGGMST